MSKEIKINASILCADFTKLGDEIKRCEDAGVDMLHVDVMDGHFVPNITVGQIIVQTVRSVTRLPIEAHLMIEHPGMYIDSFADAGADIISIQAECYGQLRPQCRELGQFPKEVDSIDAAKARKDILRIKEKGKRAFMVINPGTPLCVDALLNDLDGVMIMSVNPGFARQKFMPLALPKIEALRGKFEGDIEVDGGINEVTAPVAVRAGANILATASYFFGAAKPKDVVHYLKGLGGRRMRRMCRSRKAQTAIEYMLLLGVVVALVLVTFKTYLPTMRTSANVYFNRTALGIVGNPNPCGDGYCCSPFEDVEKCLPDCDGVGGDIFSCPPCGDGYCCGPSETITTCPLDCPSGIAGCPP